MFWPGSQKREEAQWDLLIRNATYFNIEIFMYFIQNLSRPYEKFTFIFYK